jgi:hypothetical protein
VYRQPPAFALAIAGTIRRSGVNPTREWGIFRMADAIHRF